MMRVARGPPTASCCRRPALAAAEGFQQSLMELVGCLDLRGVPKLGELDELGLRDAPCCGAAQLGIVAKLFGEFRGCAICPRRGAIQLSDHQQRRHPRSEEHTSELQS